MATIVKDTQRFGDPAGEICLSTVTICSGLYHSIGI